MESEKTLNEWSIDKVHSSIEFSVKHLMISTVKGKFKAFNGSLRLDLDDIESSSVVLNIDAGSISTEDNDRDNHLKSPDFFHVENHPVINFESSGIRKIGNGITVDGKLKIRDVTKDVSIAGELQGPIVDFQRKQRVGFDGEFSLNRKDYGLKWNMLLEGGGLTVGEVVRVNVHFELVGL